MKKITKPSEMNQIDLESAVSRRLSKMGLPGEAIRGCSVIVAADAFDSLDVLAHHAAWEAIRRVARPWRDGDREIRFCDEAARAIAAWGHSSITSRRQTVDGWLSLPDCTVHNRVLMASGREMMRMIEADAAALSAFCRAHDLAEADE